jgi:hypothetical protein
LVAGLHILLFYPEEMVYITVKALTWQTSSGSGGKTLYWLAVNAQ